MTKKSKFELCSAIYHSKIASQHSILQLFIVCNEVLKGKNSSILGDAKLSLQSSESGGKTVTDLVQEARCPLLRRNMFAST